MSLATYDRIVCDPGILRGKPIIRGTRISVEFIMELVSSGASIEDIVREYPHLLREDVEDVKEALQYATQALKSEDFILREAPSN